MAVRGRLPSAGHRRRGEPTVYTIKITLLDIRPPVWRRVEIEGSAALLELHHLVQAAMGWSGYHLHQFIHGDTYYGVSDREFGILRVSERSTRIDDLLRRRGDQLTYEYDFGDGWTHELVLETIADAEPGVTYPRVIAGKRACPPEDVGGFGGYDVFIDAMRDPAHPEHASMLEWAGGAFDPEEFDVAAANARVSRRARRGR